MAVTIDLSRRLPIGFQSFAGLRQRGYLYADKTDYVYLLTHSSKSYFLARPRRFGKSLFANTLKAYFEGRKELFEGLKITDYEKERLHYPIAYFDIKIDSHILDNLQYDDDENPEARRLAILNNLFFCDAKLSAA